MEEQQEEIRAVPGKLERVVSLQSHLPCDPKQAQVLSLGIWYKLLIFALGTEITPWPPNGFLEIGCLV